VTIKVEGLWDDGNAYAVLGKAQRAAKKAGWNKEKLEAFMKEATSGTYDHLLTTVMKDFDCEHEDDEEEE
jgi:hypothetical protein